MVDNNSSRTTKRRKRRKVITYKAVRERKRVNNSSIHQSETVSASVGDLNNSSTAAETQNAEGKGRNQRTKSDSSVSTLKTSEAGRVDNVRSNSLSTASTLKPVSVPQSREVIKSLGKRSSTQIDKKSAKNQVFNSPKKRKTSTEANEEGCQTSKAKVNNTRNNSLTIASTSKAPVSQVCAAKSPGKELSKQNDKNTAKGQVTSSPKKRKTSEEAIEEVGTSLNSSKSGTRNYRKRQKSVIFKTARERKKQLDSRRQSEELTESSNETNAKGKSKKGVTSNAPKNSSMLEQEETKGNHSVSQSQTSQKDNNLGKRSHQPSGSLTLKNSKRAKTTEKDVDESSTSETSMTKTTGTRVKTRPRKSPIIPERIRDVTVSKKAFSKWKPLSKSTKEFVDQTLKTVMLDVIADINAKENQEAVRCLTILKDRVMEKLPHLKAPYTQGEYRKMETQNKESENVLVMKSRELNALEKKIEEEQRMVEAESAMVQEYTNKLKLCEKELASLDNEKAHPLLRKTENVLDLPELPEEFFNDDEKEVPLEANSVEEIHLTQTLLKLREKANSVGLTKWMDRLGRLATDLEQQT